ncbi:MAG: tRNA glutamyl-Q(34) synthetase GluQRS [Woeseiaceae bacterium]
MATGSSAANVRPYVGRFAPSPTGPLHFGSLIAAVASFLEARTRGGQWLLRVEDIDPPREQPGATRNILGALEAYGFEWDGPVSYQSASRDQHDDALRLLLESELAYHCGCSRRDLVDAPQSSLGTIYPGTCRRGTDADETAIRVLTNDTAVAFTDGLQGRQSQRLQTESGDFIILRKDGLIAYHLAVVVDDHLQGISDIVRGIDLMDSTPRQLWLQQLLGYDAPNYSHIPVATNKRGQKLSKSFGAGGVLLDQAPATLHAALDLLGQNPPAALAANSLADIWKWALEHWNIAVLAGKTELPVGNMELAQADKNP